MATANSTGAALDLPIHTDAFHHAVTMAASALHGILNHAPIDSREAGLFHAVRFIAEGLDVAAREFENSNRGAAL